MRRGLSILLLALAGCARGSVAVQPETGAGAAEVACEQAAEPGGFTFPADRGGQLLAQVLTAATAPAAPAAEPARAVVRAEPPALARPELPLPALALAVPRIAVVPPANPVHPRALPDEAPLASQRADLVPPVRLELAAANGVRLPGLDVSQPIVLPILALPGPDREPLTDPTGAASIQAALAAAPPHRSGPAPFIPENLPDPFENRAAGRLRTVPAEEPVPVAPAPPRP